MSIKERIKHRMREVGEDRWFRVAFQMAHGNEAAMAVMMFVVDELHEQACDRVIITIPQWKAWGFGRTRVGNASMALNVAKTGVVYVNHGKLEWYIDEAKFWAAFEAAFVLVFPDMGDHDGNQHAAGAAGSEVEGESDSQGAENQHPIEMDSENKTGSNLLEVLERYRLKFTGNLNKEMIRIAGAVAALGWNFDALRVVIRRCIAAQGRTWGYLAKALENEVLALTQPRQLKLLPVDVLLAPAAPKSQRDGKSDHFAGSVNMVIDGVEMVRRHVAFGKYEWVSVQQIQREQREEAAAALAAERQRAALAQTFDDAPLVRVVEKSLPSYSGEGAAEWAMAYHQLSLQFDSQKFQAFVEGSRLVSASAGRFVVAVRNDIQREMLQNRFYRCVQRVLADACGRRDVEIEFVLEVAA